MNMMDSRIQEETPYRFIKGFRLLKGQKNGAFFDRAIREFVQDSHVLCSHHLSDFIIRSGDPNGRHTCSLQQCYFCKLSSIAILTCQRATHLACQCMLMIQTENYWIANQTSGAVRTNLCRQPVIHPGKGAATPRRIQTSVFLLVGIFSM